MTIDAEIAPYASTERDLLVKHIDKTKAGDLLLLERGYPSIWLLFLLKARGVEFCVRMKGDWWLSVKGFVESDDKERIVTYTLPKKDWKKLAGYPQMMDQSITCRLIKIELENGEKEVLCTSLTDMKKYDYSDFEELYHYRWNEEEAYKLLKGRIELENFLGKTAIAVQQDFFAKIFLMTLCAAYAHPIEERVTNEYKVDKERAHDQKINRTNALSMTQDILIAVMIKKTVQKGIGGF